MAAAVLAVGVLAAGPAHALALGRMVVLSHLGEPLRAEIEIAEINAAEASSLSVRTATPAAFKAAGLEYNPALGNLQIVPSRSSDGRSILKVTGSRPVNDPFLEVLLDANWSSGRLSRNYTLLLDPPASGVAAAGVQAQVAPQIGVLSPRAPSTLAPAAPIASTGQRITPEQRAAAIASARPSRAPSPFAAPPATSQVVVRPGDTAGRIAGSRKPANVSLDQMLVALLQANPDAFVAGNVNRIRAGAVLDIPDGAQAASVPAPEASRMVVAQSRDFNEFRRKLASRAPAVETAAPQRQASGSVQTEVEDRRSAAATPDRLTLSKATVAGQQADKVAKAGQSRDSAARAAELSRNVDELNRLGASATTANATVPASADTAPAAGPTPAPAPAPAAAAASGESAVAPATAPAISPPADAPPAADASAPPVAAAAGDAATASPNAPAAPVAAPAPAVPPAAEPGLFSGLMEDMRLVGGIGLLILLIGALVAFRAVQRRRAARNDSHFLDSHLPQDSFFGASGGQHVDTTEAGAVSSLATTYSPSQLDAGGDVDPLAEADVYLAYGRDAQAEEILREALKSQPGRLAVHAKLAEIYAKRQDATAFHTIAAEAHRVSAGSGEEWERIRKLGHELDAGDALYQPVAPSLAEASMAAAATGAVAATSPTSSAAVSSPVAPLAAAAASTQLQPATEPRLDLDLNEQPHAGADAANGPETARSRAALAEADALAAAGNADSPLAMDFSAFQPSPPPLDSVLPQAEKDDDDFGLEFTLDTPEDKAMFPAKAAAEPAVASAPAPAPAPAFDLSHLSLDLDSAPSAGASAGAATAAASADSAGDQDFARGELAEISGEDSLATKLALAEEFGAIGDTDGARHLIEEVIAESSGSVRERAERMLRDLD